MTPGTDSSIWAVLNSDTIINITDGDVSTWIDDDTIATALVSNRADRETIVVTYDVPSE